MLESLDITVERVRAQVIRIEGAGEEVTSGQIPFTPRASKVLELAPREAEVLSHSYIGPEHILLGLVRGNEGVATRILLDFDADAEKVRSEVIRRLAGHAWRERPDVPAPEEIQPAMLSDRELDDAVSELLEAERSLSDKLRVVRAKLDILRAERDNRGSEEHPT